jgi:CRISPR-associated protein Cmr4
MFNSTRIITFCAQTSVHAGTGNDIGGVIDLPIKREKHTNFPKFESSSLKGCLRDKKKKKKGRDFHGLPFQDVLQYAFGPEGDTYAAASMAITDARCLLFPVASVKGVFAWVTCPMALERFVSDLLMAGISYDKVIPSAYTIPAASELALDKKRIMLDENVYGVSEDTSVNEMAKYILRFCSDKAVLLHKYLEKNIAVLSDEIFKDIVTMGTEVLFRNKINPDTGTVEKNMLFQEEMLPPESVLYSLLMTGPIFEKPDKKEKINEAVKTSGLSDDEFIMSFLTETGYLPPIIQLGGDATLGKGLLAVEVTDKSEAGQ